MSETRKCRKFTGQQKSELDDPAVQLGDERVPDESGPRPLELDQTGDRRLVTAVRRTQDQALPVEPNFGADDLAVSPS